MVERLHGLAAHRRIKSSASKTCPPDAVKGSDNGMACRRIALALVMLGLARDKSAWTDRNGNVWLMNGTEGTHLIKPGQSIDRNGVIEDLLPPGAVARR
jgi:hypothetical protein